MDREEVPVHGGDLAAAVARFGEPSAGWLDLSTGISPHLYPLPPLPLQAWTRLPGRDSEARLLSAAARCYGADRASIVAAPGSQALIGALAAVRAPSRVAVVSPTYAEHAYRWRAAGHEVSEVGADDIPAGTDVCIVVNPNNPDGTRLARGTLMGIYQRLAHRGGWLVVDEAFADVAPENSVADWTGEPGLVVLRSFGKFFGLAGVRLGFALSDEATAGPLRHHLGPWAVSGPALEVGCRALSDAQWIGDQRQRLRDGAAALDAVLADAGLKPTGGTALFRLVDDPAARRIHEGLAAEGILTRWFPERPNWLRLGLPGDTSAFERLRKTLVEVISGI